MEDKSEPATPSIDAIQAAAFRRLVDHLKERTDVQNIDLMNLSGFCRNCLARWLLEASSASGGSMDIDQARKSVYGMGYSEWKSRYQR